MNDETLNRLDNGLYRLGISDRSVECIVERDVMSAVICDESLYYSQSIDHNEACPLAQIIELDADGSSKVVLPSYQYASTNILFNVSNGIIYYSANDTDAEEYRLFSINTETGEKLSLCNAQDATTICIVKGGMVLSLDSVWDNYQINDELRWFDVHGNSRPELSQSLSEDKAFWNELMFGGLYSNSTAGTFVEIKEQPANALYYIGGAESEALLDFSLADGKKAAQIVGVFCADSNRCCGVETVKMPDTVRALTTGAFVNCEKLTSCELSSEITGIPRYAVLKNKVCKRT